MAQQDSEPLRQPPDVLRPAPQTLRGARLVIFLVFVLIGVAYLFVPERLTVGPSWLPLTVIGAFLVPFSVAHYREAYHISRGLIVGLLALLTTSVIGSAALLIFSLPVGKTSAVSLLRDASSIWVLNWVVFAVWYWEIDAGGPVKRRMRPYVSDDFVFPQTIQPLEDQHDWQPEFLDYLFLAFNTSTAFSPTDTLILSQRAKGLMMIQTIVSLITLAVLVARAINTLS